MFDPYAFEAIEWDDAEDPDGNWLIAFGTGWMSRWSPRFFGCTGVEVGIGLERPNARLLARMNADGDCGPFSLTRAVEEAIG